MLGRIKFSKIRTIAISKQQNLMKKESFVLFQNGKRYKIQPRNSKQVEIKFTGVEMY